MVGFVVSAVFFAFHSTSVNMAVETYIVRCELHPITPNSCVMKSPRNVPNPSVPTPCLTVHYYLTSDDVALTADIFVAGDKIIAGVKFRHDRTIIDISLSDLPSMYFTVSFTARRSLTSDSDTQYADIKEVRLGSCHSLGEC